MIGRACCATRNESQISEGRDATMSELLVDFITSLDGYAAAEGWPGW